VGAGHSRSAGGASEEEKISGGPTDQSLYLVEQINKIKITAPSSSKVGGDWREATPVQADAAVVEGGPQG